MIRLLAWVALLGMVAIGGMPWPTAVLAAPSLNPGDLCTLIGSLESQYPNVGKWTRLDPVSPPSEKCEGQYANLHLDLSLEKDEKKASPESILYGTRRTEIPGLGDAAVSRSYLGVDRDGQTQRSYYAVSFGRSPYYFVGVIFADQYELLLQVAQQVDGQIVDMEKPTTPPVPTRTPSPAATPTPRPTLRSSSSGLGQGVDAIATVGEDANLVNFVKSVPGSWDPVRAGTAWTKAEDSLLNAIGSSTSLTDLQLKDVEYFGLAYTLSTLSGRDGKAMFPSLRAAMPVVAKLALRATTDPDALVALKRYVALLYGMDIRVEEER